MQASTTDVLGEHASRSNHRSEIMPRSHPNTSRALMPRDAGTRAAACCGIKGNSLLSCSGLKRGVHVGARRGCGGRIGDPGLGHIVRAVSTRPGAILTVIRGYAAWGRSARSAGRSPTNDSTSSAPMHLALVRRRAALPRIRVIGCSVEGIIRVVAIEIGQ